MQRLNYAKVQTHIFDASFLKTYKTGDGTKQLSGDEGYSVVTGNTVDGYLYIRWAKTCHSSLSTARAHKIELSMSLLHRQRKSLYYVHAMPSRSSFSF